MYQQTGHNTLQTICKAERNSFIDKIQIDYAVVIRESSDTVQKTVNAGSIALRPITEVRRPPIARGDLIEKILGGELIHINGPADIPAGTTAKIFLRNIWALSGNAEGGSRKRVIKQSQGDSRELLPATACGVRFDGIETALSPGRSCRETPPGIPPPPNKVQGDSYG